MKLKARIYRPAKTAMSSGRRKTRQWVYEFAPAIKNAPEPLMGWNSGGTLQQVRLEFDTKEAAIAYAKSKGVPFEVEVPHERRVVPKSYAANFAFERRTAFQKNRTYPA